MEMCLKKLGLDLCSCAFPDGDLNVDAWLGQLSQVEIIDFILQYQTFDREPSRRLCKVGRCKKCGKLYCESVGIPEDKTGYSFFAAVYRWLYQLSYHLKPEYRDNTVFREAYLNLYKEGDREEVEKWMRLPESEHIFQMYRN